MRAMDVCAALRALGFAREDQDLVERVSERFRTMRCDWHAEQTRSLLVAS
jgi:hypothetical protein